MSNQQCYSILCIVMNFQYNVVQQTALTHVASSPTSYFLLFDLDYPTTIPTYLNFQKDKYRFSKS